MNSYKKILGIYFIEIIKSDEKLCLTKQNRQGYCYDSMREHKYLLRARFCLLIELIWFAESPLRFLVSSLYSVQNFLQLHFHGFLWVESSKKRVAIGPITWMELHWLRRWLDSIAFSSKLHLISLAFFISFLIFSFLGFWKFQWGLGFSVDFFVFWM